MVASRSWRVSGARVVFRSSKVLSFPVLGLGVSAMFAGFAALVYACSKRMRSLSYSW